MASADCAQVAVIALRAIPVRGCAAHRHE